MNLKSKLFGIELESELMVRLVRCARLLNLRLVRLVCTPNVMDVFHPSGCMENIHEQRPNQTQIKKIKSDQPISDLTKPN